MRSTDFQRSTFAFDANWREIGAVHLRLCHIQPWRAEQSIASSSWMHAQGNGELNEGISSRLCRCRKQTAHGSCARHSRCNVHKSGEVLHRCSCPHSYAMLLCSANRCIVCWLEQFRRRGSAGSCHSWFEIEFYFLSRQRLRFLMKINLDFDWKEHRRVAQRRNYPERFQGLNELILLRLAFDECVSFVVLGKSQFSERKEEQQSRRCSHLHFTSSHSSSACLCNSIHFTSSEQSANRVMVVPRYGSDSWTTTKSATPRPSQRSRHCGNMHVIFDFGWFSRYNFGNEFRSSAAPSFHAEDEGEEENKEKIDHEGNWRTDSYFYFVVTARCSLLSPCVCACVWLQFVCVWPISTILMMRE